MKNHDAILRKRRLPAFFVCLPFMLLLAGCSQDYVSVDDVYVPASADERFPIQVVEAPFKLNVTAQSGALRHEDINRLAAFASAANQEGSSPVSVRYPSSSPKARNVSQQAVKLLMGQGVPRSIIHVEGYKGKSNVVSLSFTRKAAVTPPCGDWSENLRRDQFNEPGPNFGCSVRNNMAAMVANPEDFERPRKMGPGYAARQIPYVDKLPNAAGQ